MAPRSPSMERICQAAVTHFAERGYDAASLNDIAEAVAIRKASLYSHVSGKDELYMEVFGDALRIERDYAAQCVQAENQADLPGERYCASLSDRYASSVHLRFLLRTAYLPPVHLDPAISEGYEKYLGQLRDAFAGRLQAMPCQSGLAPQLLELYGQAYLGIVDSLHVELVYTGGRRFGVRWQAMRHLLATALGQPSRKP